ncbi:hypothetical protein BGZ95_003047 [Linnemannia exigua]|uniref:C-type lectin domain-containing protein n=1 Tax=Linnemannia exigua TaxID=604196 RepID=A0AAD4D4N9_9FUNG|nr:hypothetical protein BGZ95_003047 [Linnemannia exigua]
MKVTTILTVLVAAALAAPSYAAPTARPTKATPHKNATVTDDEAFFNAHYVKYDYEGMAKIAAEYEAAMAGSSLHRSNAVSRAAVSTSIIPICVGFAKGPVRVRLFRNKLTCDIAGWNTLYVFTAHAKKDDYLAAKQMCVALGTDERRSWLFAEKSKCGGGEWKDDFVYYDSTNVYESATMWTAPNPNRMLLYPTYEGGKHGWTGTYGLRHRNQFRLASSGELKTFKGEYVNHVEVHKKLTITATPDAKTLRCVSLMAEAMPTAKVSDNGRVEVVQGNQLTSYAAFAFDAKCTDLVTKSQFRSNQAKFSGVGSMELIINNKVHAAISIKQGLTVGGSMLRTALLESLRSGQPVMVTESNGYHADDGVIAYIQGTGYVIGNAQIWNAVI